MNKVEELYDKYNIVDIKPLNEGWSNDKKIILTSGEGDRYLLRLSEGNLYDKKKEHFKRVELLNNFDINCVKPIDFGGGVDYICFELWTYAEGRPAIDVVPQLDNERAYSLGCEAGYILNKIHKLPCNELASWWERYESKINKKLDALKRCEYHFSNEKQILSYYIDNLYLVKDRPLTFNHGDYHLGNMLVCDERPVIIDFDKSNYADPFDEFKPYCWSAMRSEYFETGLINAYFDDKVPDEFWKILKLYTAEMLISHLPWAVKFGEGEIKTAFTVYERIMKWYDRFERDIPSWYKNNIV